MKRLIPGILLLALGIAIAVFLVINIEGRDITSALGSIAFEGVAVTLFLTLIIVFVSTWRTQIILRSRGYSIPFWKSVPIWIAGYGFSYIAPFTYVGSEGIRAHLLKERFNIPWEKSISILLIERILELTASVLTVIVAVSVLITSSGFSGLTETLISVIVSLTVIGIIMILFYLQVFRGKQTVVPLMRFLSLHNTRVGRFLYKTENDIVYFFSNSRKAIWYVWLLSLLRSFLALIKNLLLIYFLGRGLHIVASLISLGALYIGYVVPIPGAIGIQEAFQSILFSVFGFEAGEGLALSFTLRIADFIVAGMGIFILLRHGSRLIIQGASSMIKGN